MEGQEGEEEAKAAEVYMSLYRDESGECSKNFSKNQARKI